MHFIKIVFNIPKIAVVVKGTLLIQGERNWSELIGGSVEATTAKTWKKTC